MNYHNIEIHNVAEILECEASGISWIRVPTHVYDAMESEKGKTSCKNSTGVELRFVMQSDVVTLKLQALSLDVICPQIYVYYGGIQGGYNCYELHADGKLFELVIHRPSHMERLRKISKESGFDWDAAVVRVILSGGAYCILDIIGDVCLPRQNQMPQKTILAYGSSITHGSNALGQPHSWTSVLARNLNMDVINLGMAGSCRMEHLFIDYIASEGERGNWDIATLELGINVLDWEESVIRERVTYTLKQIAGRNPDKKIVLISPFYCYDDYQGLRQADKWRKLIATIVQETNYENVRLCNGLDLLGNVSLLSSDEVHPNIYGVQQIAERLTKRIRDFL